MEKPKREPISKKIRFEVFKRDNFTCQYCGKTPPNVMLEIDHIKPISKGGSNNINNLVTSCFDCNRGKSNHSLKVMPNTLAENHEILVEKEEQLKEYHKLIRKIEKRHSQDAQKISEVYSSYFEDYTLKDRFLNGTVKLFLRQLEYYQVEEAMHLACAKMKHKDKSINYFCGICWNKIKGITPSWEN